MDTAGLATSVDVGPGVVIKRNQGWVVTKVVMSRNQSIGVVRDANAMPAGLAEQAAGGGGKKPLKHQEEGKVLPKPKR